LSSYFSHASSSRTSVFVFDVLHIFYFITYNIYSKCRT
jgi:hypothetical protein